MKLASIFALVGGLGLLLVAACGGSSSSSTSTSSPTASASTLKLGDISVSDHGTKDFTNAATANLQIDDFYFSPTFVKGTAGQKIKLTLTNASATNTLHNFSVPALGIDKDVAAKGSVDIDVTLPASGVLLFLCKYHTGQGMNGELLAGAATPQAPAAVAAVAPTIKATTNATLGSIVTDPAGRTLYINKNDVPNSGKSTVTGQTAVTWPPLALATGNPAKGSDLKADVALITRDDGSKQVTYNGMPLYYFAQDANPGDTNGQGRANVWYVLNADGTVKQ